MSTAKFDPARLPEPDEFGFFVHPDMPGDDESDDVSAMLRETGFEFSTVCFDIDADESDADAWFSDDLPADEMKAIMMRWHPTPPQGEGWISAAKYDTDSGPLALFVRPVQSTKGGS